MFPCTGVCLDSLYIIAFTSGLNNAESSDGHAVEIVLTDKVTKRYLLPNLPGNDYEKYKGDLWKISLSDQCIRKYDIESIAIVENSNDGWNIETIVTYIKSGNYYEPATSNFDVNYWIDGNHEDVTRLRFELTPVY